MCLVNCFKFHVLQRKLCVKKALIFSIELKERKAKNDGRKGAVNYSRYRKFEGSRVVAKKVREFLDAASSVFIELTKIFTTRENEYQNSASIKKKEKLNNFSSLSRAGDDDEWTHKW
jgi:hypothetical protein